MAKYFLSIVLCTVVLAALTLILVFVQVPPYTNMSETQVEAQADRYLSLQVAACKKAGGDWSTTMTAGGCNVLYPQPDMSWMIDPISNPAYDTWQLVQPGLILVAIIDGVVLLILLAILIEERCIRRSLPHVEQSSSLFRRRRPESGGAQAASRSL